ncbi:PTS glucitol/sorbitol transporter subunit IIA [Domibacillus sp. DTU_2020_1001157_1_SI_ALB_TIR_016]|uniref:PTS glucitol/sorbitol transporter subunit IIA n=1 Tax=Domibacillus sp. DTU_2020_1001157_1_SI_ALB_TIR_016 TaxID=3077789 RepID=UPI0028E21B2F|nr:PTS glucitol/sorbitol transporter subunit IIA [Domibacillus sp. DTU_2020_1001157_1_SI_ALB_TIR_016]WNS78636.1 PTS glucitol/sorbitol transporter subunit IIA [Domibacillus sp. DTU_2020_1001157_1_SI_ALB_TIR_016]
MSIQESVQLKTIYQSTVTELGADVEMFAEEKMIILFNESAPKDLRDIAVSHTVVSLEGTIEAGDILSFDDQSYEITFVGGKVNETVSELGHCTIAFNGADHADLPGTMCVEEKAMPNINVSTKLSIIKK